MRPHVVHWLEALLPGGVASAIAPTWFTCVGLAGVVALFAMLAIARRRGLDRGAVAAIVLWCHVTAVAAGIAVPAAIDTVQQLLATGHAQLRWAGMTSFWGYLAGGCAVAAACRTHDIPLRRFADLAVLPLGLALTLARVGCFLAGCDHGKVTALPWAVRFPAHSPAWQDHVDRGLIPLDRAASLPVHPTQLYEAVLGLVIAGLALVVARRPWARRGDGRLFVLAAAVYAVGRLAIEDLRGDTGRGIYLGLSSGQIFSWLVLAAIALPALRRLRRLRPLPIAPAAAGLAAVLLAAAPAAAQSAPPAIRSPPPAPDPRAASPGPASPGPMSPGPASPGPASPGPAAVSAPAAAESTGAGSIVQLGALVGTAMPFNRRSDQVAALGGVSLSIGLGFRQLGLWLDLDSFGNRDASHGTIVLSGSMTAPVTSRLSIGGRVGLGATLVNFDDPAFRDVAGTDVRFEALVDYRLGASWALWLRPLSFDVLSAADLGGPIATWQARIGIAYRFAVGRSAGPASPPAMPPPPAAAPVPERSR